MGQSPCVGCIDASGQIQEEQQADAVMTETHMHGQAPLLVGLHLKAEGTNTSDSKASDGTGVPSEDGEDAKGGSSTGSLPTTTKASYNDPEEMHDGVDKGDNLLDMPGTLSMMLADQTMFPAYGSSEGTLSLSADRLVRTEALSGWRRRSRRISTRSAAPTNAESDLFQADEGFPVMRMIFAASQGKLDVVRMMLDSGVQVNSQGYDNRTCLHVAVTEGNLDVVKLLIGRGADVDIKDRWNRTPKDDLNQIKDKGLRNAISEALRAKPTNLADNLPRPFSKGTNASLDSQQQLFATVAAGNMTALEKLLGKGADVTVADSQGWTAMHVAAAHGHLAVVQLLMSKKVDPNVADNSGTRPAALAFTNGHDHIVEVLGGVDDAEQDRLFLRCASQEEGWAIQHVELQHLEVLAKTNKSCVYEAEWNGVKVVAKTVKPEAVASGAHGRGHMSSKEYEELLHEIQILSTTRHPDLVLFLGACLDAQPYYIISEFMEGGDLDNYYMVETRRAGRPYKPKWAQLVRWMSAIARALCFLHTRRCPIIHRDLKPLNIFLTKQLDAKVADFGLSKIMSYDDMQNAADGKYMSGGVGTWRYMAPEVVRHEQYTESVDIYSFSLIIHFMATGIPPFMQEFGRDAELVLKEYIKGNEPRPALPSSLGTSSLRQLVQECWNPIPTQRPSAQTCVDRLVEIGAAPQGVINVGMAAIKRASRSFKS